MKKFSLILILAGFTATVHAQRTKKISRDELAFNQAYKTYDSMGYEQGLKAFKEFMKTYPSSRLVASAHFNVGYINRQLHRNAEAVASFKSILEQDYNERDPNSLMEPYKLYKHQSCRQLAEIFLEEKNFDEAGHYIDLFDKEYPYQHFCGNEWAAYNIYVATMRARVYEGKNEVGKAIDGLVPYIFENGLASNGYLVEQLADLLNRHFTYQEIRNELTNSISTLKISKKKDRESASITLFGTNVDVWGYLDDESEDLTGPERYKRIVETSQLFRNFPEK